MSPCVWGRTEGDKPESHARSRDGGKLNGAREPLVPLWIIVLEADLKLHGLKEVSLFLVLGMIEKLLHILAHSGCIHLSAISLLKLTTAIALTDCDF
jgi:hypothetical protein